MTQPALRHERMGPHFEKWHLETLVPGFALHRFTAPDSGDPHDHPFDFTTHILAGGYVEEVFAPDGTMQRIKRLPGTSHHVSAGHVHRIVELPTGECVTAAIYGSYARAPRFYRWDADGCWSRRWDSREWELHL